MNFHTRGKKLAILGLSAAMLLCGCGTAASDSSVSDSTDTSISSDSNASSAASETSGTSETSGSAKTSDTSGTSKSGQQDSTTESAGTSDSAKNKSTDPKDYANQVPSGAKAVRDESYSARKASVKGSLKTFNGKYRLVGALGSYYYFCKENTAYYVLSGDYKYTKDSDDKAAVSLQFKSSDSATVYTLSKKDKTTTLTGISSSGDTTKKLACTLLTGTDGLSSKKKFEGIYLVGGSEDYRLEFHSDGTFYMVLEQTYETDGNELTLTSLGNALTYTWKVNGKKIILSQNGTEAAELKPGA
jgi:hypothetical protein